MLTLYLACLVFGGVLLAISLFAGGDADSSADGGLDAHGDFAGGHEIGGHGELTAGDGMDDVSGAALEVHADTAGHLPTDATLDGDHPALLTVEHTSGDAAPSAHSAFEYLSFRNFVYTTTFFGLTGSALTWMSTPVAPTLASAIGMGLFAGYVGHRFMKYLRASESGEAMHVSSLLGHQASVIIPPTKDGKGKIRVTAAGHRVELIALLHADADDTAPALRPGDPVFIVAIDREVAFVDRGDFLESAD
ncbi:MAG: hypothetical protein RBU27_14370 [Bacteroidota bacterium]|jgi:hypothetical protein|nr:hypothetical protein [Bacteroidota bacterium]